MIKNWKTTSTGITLIVAGIVGIYFAQKNNQMSEAAITGALTSFLTGIGLLFSKDHDSPDATLNPSK